MYFVVSSLKGKINCQKLTKEKHFFMKNKFMTAVRYSIITAKGNIIMIGALAILIELLGVQSLWAYPIAFLFMADSNFDKTYSSVVKQGFSKPRPLAYRKYMTVATGSMLVNQIVAVIAEYHYGIAYYWTVFIAGIACFLWSYSFNKKYTWTFSSSSMKKKQFMIPFLIVLIAAIITTMQYY